MQAIVFPADNDTAESIHGIVNVTGNGVGGSIKLPYTTLDGRPVYLGDEGLGYPPSLYPNFTYNHSQDGQLQTYIGKTKLEYNTTFFIGPLNTNDTFALFSVTMAVNNNTSRTETLGWLTVVLDANLLYEVVLSPEGLDSTGEILLVGPTVKHNKFATPVRGVSVAVDGEQQVKFVFPPQSNSTLGNRHSLRSAVDGDRGNSSIPFNMSQYPAVLDAWTAKNHGANNAGSMISTHNEQGIEVSVGYATLSTQLVDWALVLEQSTGKGNFNPGFLGLIFR